ncbi:MAG: GNAT family N-acetyltransferase [Candidatus Kapaibacteriales bacterium]
MQLSTQRTILRPLSPNDADSFYLINTDKEVLKYTGDEPFASVEEARVFLEGYDQYQKYGVGRMAVISKSDNNFLGWCGLKYHPGSDMYDIGFRFFRKYWGKGYATESARACIEYGLKELKIKKIVGRAHKENIASHKAMEKCGMNFVKEFDFEGQTGVWYEIDGE